VGFSLRLQTPQVARFLLPARIVRRRQESLDTKALSFHPGKSKVLVLGRITEDFFTAGPPRIESFLATHNVPSAGEAECSAPVLELITFDAELNMLPDRGLVYASVAKALADFAWGDGPILAMLHGLQESGQPRRQPEDAGVHGSL
jgi:hypothetical protein